MRKRLAGISVLGIFVLLIIMPSVFVAQRRTNRPAAQPAPTPARNDLKITYRTTTSGQSMETTTMLKGARERSEMKLGSGRDIINITQCDLRRTVQISDSAKKYLVTPMDTADSAPGSGVASGAASEPSTRGGVITYATSAVDTGERKEMFGFQARHVKTSTVIESSPDACSPLKQRMETDGWYIDFSFGLNCERGGAPQMGGMPSQGGCRDRIRFNRQGAARTGYPLEETTTSYGPDGRAAFTSTKQVIELSREPLDAALFDVPPGYVETTNAQELYGMPSMDAIMSQAKGQAPVDDSADNASLSSNRKAPGAVRVGIVQINNRTERQISTESLRERLIGEIEGAGVDAIALNASSPSEAEAEAKAKQCDFILFTDVASLKSSGAKKLFGRVAGVGGADKTEAKIEFKLFAVGNASPLLQSAATAKEEGDDASAGTAVSQEARAVTAEVKRKGRS
jgi:hypothetical protein